MTGLAAGTRARRKAGRRRGSALLVVVLMLGMIAALAAVIARSVSSAAVDLAQARAVAQSETDLRAGIEVGAAAVLKLGERVRSAEASVNLANRRIEVRITNERARIDLNAARPQVLSGLFQTTGMFEEDARSLAASIMEWRGGSASQKLAAPASTDRSLVQFPGFDPFDTKPGSELRKGAKQSVGTRYFQHPMQLASVPGVSKALVAALLPHVTVANASDKIDPYIADERVLLALPGNSPGNVDAFGAARDSNTSRGTAIAMLGASPELLTTEAASGWRLQISSRLQNGRVFRSEAVVVILEGDSEPYRVLYVLDDQERAVRPGSGARQQ